MHIVYDYRTFTEMIVSILYKLFQSVQKIEYFLIHSVPNSREKLVKDIKVIKCISRDANIF